jgi:predicted outer membrane repeat protein
VVGCKKDEPSSPAALEVTPTELDFGVVGVGSESTLEITLSNTGGEPVTLLSASLIEGDSDHWSVDRNAIDTLEAGATGLVLVTYAPEEQVPESGQVQIRTDLAEGGSFLVGLAGRGGLSDEDYDQDGFSIADGDCDDGDPAQNPGADEICDGQDTDCDGNTPADENDGDGDGWLVCEGDCDDGNGATNPDAEEICDDQDNDCDDDVEDRADQDGDGFDICAGDCDDEEGLARPGGVEVCDEVDNDCNGQEDDIDRDLDGHTVCSAAGDCDDEDPAAYPVVVAEGGDPYGLGTDLDPVDSIESALAILDTVCRTVVLEPGTYDEVDVEWTSGEVSIVGRTGDPDEVTVVAETDQRAFEVRNATLILRHVTLTGGNPTEYLNQDGGAINVSDGELVLDNVVLSGNSTDTRGGAIAAQSSTVTLDDCVFDSNVAGSDGGAIYVETSTLDDDDSRYEDNSGSLGGALRVVSGALTLDGVEIRENTAEEGGGIAISAAGTYTIERSTIVLNQATGAGGGIALRDVDSPSGLLRNNRIQDNSADEGGGGVAVVGASAAIEIANDTFTGNTAGGEGAAVAVDVVGDATGVSLLANVMHANDGPSAMYVVGGAFVRFNTGFFTNSGVHFAGEIVDGGGAPVDGTNVVRDPLLISFSDDGDPDNDDLGLQAGSPEIDSGPGDPSYNDLDGTQNDRGYTGGPGAD